MRIFPAFMFEGILLRLQCKALLFYYALHLRDEIAVDDMDSSHMLDQSWCGYQSCFQHQRPPASKI